MLAPIATSQQYRHDPYRMFTGFEGLPQFGGPLGMMVMQTFGGQFMGLSGRLPMGLSEQNLYDRLQAMRMQQMHDDFVAQASRHDQETYFQSLRGFSRMMGTPWGRPQIEAAQNLSEMMAAAGPMAVQFLPPQLIDAMGGMRGMNVVMAEHMFQGGRFRLDPVTGRSGLDAAAMTRLNEQVFQSMFAGDAWRRGAGLSAGEAGQLFNELQLIGMVGGGTRMEDLIMQMQGTPVGPGMPGLLGRERQSILNRAANMGIGADQLRLNQLSPEQIEGLKADPDVAASLQAFDSRRVVQSLESYAGVIKAMREIFGDAGYPNAPMPELINALNQLTGGALPQLSPGQVENMARVTTNLARSTGLGLEATMMLSDVAAQQAMAMGLPPIFGADALQHSLAFRGAYQQLGMGAFPAWGLSSMDEQALRDLQLTTAAAGSRLSNQMGAALRIEEALAPEGAAAFRDGSAAANWLEAVRIGADTFLDPTTGKRRGLNLQENEFVRMMMEGANFDLDEATAARFLGQQGENLEFVQRAGVANVVRRAQRGEFMQYLTNEAQFNAQEAIGNLDLAGMDFRGRQGLGLTTAEAAIEQLFKLTPGQRTHRETRNRLMAQGIEERLQAIAGGELDVEGVSQDQARELLQRFRADDNFRALFVEEIYGAAGTASRRPDSTFGPMSLQDALQQFDRQVLNQADRNRAREEAVAMEQRAFSPLGRSGMLRRAMQAVIDAEEGTDIADILAETLGGERGTEIAGVLGPRQEELQRLAREFEAQARAYESAPDADARAAMLEPLRAAQLGYQDAVAEAADALQRAGFATTELVTEEDAARMVRASSYLRGIRSEAKADPTWADDSQNVERMAKAVAVDRERRDDFVAMVYTDPALMRRLGNRGLAELANLEAAQAELDTLATLYTGGDMGVLMRNGKPEGMTDADWKQVRGRRAAAMRQLWGAQDTLAAAVGKSTDADYDYLLRRHELEAIQTKVAGVDRFDHIKNLGDLLSLVADEDIAALVEEGVLTAGEGDILRGGQADFAAFQDRVARAQADFFKPGERVLAEGMARLRLGAGETDEAIAKEADRLAQEEGLAELQAYFGGAESYEEMLAMLDEVSPGARQRKHAFAELLRDPEALAARADDLGMGFDPAVGGIDMAEVLEKLPAGGELEEGAQEPQQMEITLKGPVAVRVVDDDRGDDDANGVGVVQRGVRQ